MATIVLSAVGASLGGAIGGSVLGLSSAVLGRAVGATLGNVIDQWLLGSRSKPVETGRIDRFRLNGASEGATVPVVFGRMRVGGQVIWASPFEERAVTTGGGKGTRSSGPETTTYSYYVSVAIALCEGEIARVGRVWADGNELAPDEIAMRVYTGTEDQVPDPKIETVEGIGRAPAYRGTAYVVIEDLALGPFGNRVPQFSFEVVRPEPEGLAEVADVSRLVRGVAMMPGTGEYALATTPVHFEDAPGVSRTANVHTPGAETDFDVSLRALREEMPGCGAVSLIVSWFGDDLRAGECSVRPKVEQRAQDGVGQAWRAGGLARAEAGEIAQIDGRPVYGGTPSDASVIEAIRRMASEGLDVMFYPFLLMEQLPGNALPDPWSGAAGQAPFPWRGRITTSAAPGQAGSPDGTAAAETEVAAFFGTAQAGDFSVAGEAVSYAGPAEFSYRRFILHYAHLCAVAGGVEAFCIGSEMRSLTQVRGAGNTFPAVEAFRELAADVRGILGPGVKISYAADWSEYFGYHPQDGSGDVFFHLDPLWADPNIDFVGIDNYMPLSDWRDGAAQADAAYGAIYNLDYLKANIEGGEGFDWYYHAPEAEAIQLRTPITDGAYGEPWVYRYKDLRSWWSNVHHDRVGGARVAVPTGWVPRSKPIRFTEYGCPAVDRGTNEPNKFYDPKSSESAFPKHSTGQRDDLIQMQYVRALTSYWDDPEVNPVSPFYGAPMLDMGHAYLWAWEARPYPHFPARTDLWSDGPNYELGHWMTGRAALRSLASVVSEICARAGLGEREVRELYGIVRGYVPADVSTARGMIEPLMLAHGFDAAERDGCVAFRTRGLAEPRGIDLERVAVLDPETGDIAVTRAPVQASAERVSLTHVEADGAFEVRTAEAAFPQVDITGVSRSELPMALTGAEARAIAERWMAEAQVARVHVRLALPLSRCDLGAGDVVEVPGVGQFRLDGVEETELRLCEGMRVEPGLYRPAEYPPVPVTLKPSVPPLPVDAVFLDLPLLAGDEDPAAPFVAVQAAPWAGAAVYASLDGAAFALETTVSLRATTGVTETDLAAAPHGVWDRGAPLRLRLFSGALVSVGEAALFAGANAMAIGTGQDDDWEVFQFRDAVLVAPGVWEISHRLRGQAGTDALIPSAWPSGSRVVLLDAAPVQLPLPSGLLGLERVYRYGPRRRPVDDSAFRETVRAFSGVGLRPYAPVHLRARFSDSGALDVTWVRRTRSGGDGWSVSEVPLSESFERYRVEVRDGSGVLRRSAEVSSPGWSYGAAERVADGVTAPFHIDVAQISDRFGPGLFRRITIHE